MKTNLKNHKFVLFSALVLSMIIPFSGINMVSAIQSTDPYHIGTVADGTYNETAALKRVTQIMNARDGLMQEKAGLELQLSKSTSPADVNAINVKISDIQGQIDQIMQEFNEIQAENLKLYYVEPTLLTKYNSAKDDFVNTLQNQYWKGKSFEDIKNSFPLVSIAVDGKKKAVDITLWKGIEGSPKAEQYVAIINQLMPKDIPWYVSYDEYSTAYSCTSRTTTCSPLIGGIEIGVNIVGGQQVCTLGYYAKRTSDNALGFVTAGHCEQGLTGNTVTQPSSNNGGSGVGTASTSVYSSGSDCDCGWVKLNSGVTISDSIFNTGSTTYKPTSVTTQSSQTAGTLIKQSGLTSGIQTGSVTSSDASAYVSGVFIQHLVQDSITAAGGDSGAPVTSSDGTSLFGHIVSGNSMSTYHSPENRAAADLGVTIIVG